MINKVLICIFFTFSTVLFSQTISDSIILGKENLYKQDYYRAIEYFKEALKQNPKDSAANMGLSDSFFMIGEYEEALLYIDVCLKLSRNDLELLNRKARIYTALQKYEEAEEIYKNVLKKEMYNIGAQSGLAELRIVNGDIEGSLYDFEKILKFSPESRRLLLSLVVLYDRQKKYTKGDSLIQSAIRYYPQDPIVLESAVRHYMSSGKFSGASIYMEELINISDNENNKLLQAELQIYLEDYEAAVKTLTSYMKVVKDNPESYYLGAVALNRMGVGDSALSLLKRAMDIRPDEEIYRFFSESIMDKLYLLKDDSRKKYSEWYYENGKNLEARFYYKKAKSYYLRGLDLDPLSFDLRYAYGRVLKKMGFNNKYLNELDLILNHYDDKKEIKEIYDIEKSLPLKDLYMKWGGDRFINNNRFNISVSVNSKSIEHNIFSSHVISSIAERFLSGRSRFDVKGVEVYNGEFSKAFNTARELNSEYFAVISFLEGSRTFSLKATIHLTKSGREIQSFNYLKTGNNRVFNCFDNLSNDLNSFFPVVASVIDVKGNEVLIDVGSYNNIDNEMSFNVVKKGSLYLIPEEPFISYEDDKLLGTIKLNNIGEGISDGLFNPVTSFNLLNVGDQVILAEETDQKLSNDDPFVIDTELIEQLLQVN